MKKPISKPLSNSPSETAPSSHHFKLQPLEQRPGLYVVATPIGNLKDISLRALEILASVNLILCEDTRTSRKLLQHYGLKNRLSAYHEHNADQVRPKIIEQIQQGASIALISDAGTPLISDPGYKLVEECAALDLYTTSIPGACAAITGLTLAALPTHHFFFAGFLPPKSSGRKKALEGLKILPATLLFYESPHRLAEMLEDAHQVLGPRRCVVARELTKLHEETIRGTLQDVANVIASRTVLGECVVIIEGALEQEQVIKNEFVLQHLRDQLNAGHSLKEAVAHVTAATGLPRRTIYQLALAIDSREQK